jgi:hypothetical protein
MVAIPNIPIPTFPTLICLSCISSVDLSGIIASSNVTKMKGAFAEIIRNGDGRFIPSIEIMRHSGNSRTTEFTKKAATRVANLKEIRGIPILERR